MTHYREVQKRTQSSRKPRGGSREGKAAGRVMSFEVSTADPRHDSKGLTGNNGEDKEGDRPHRENQQPAVTPLDLGNGRK